MLISPVSTLMSYVDAVWNPGIGNTQGAVPAHYGWWVRAAASWSDRYANWSPSAASATSMSPWIAPARMP